MTAILLRRTWLDPYVITADVGGQAALAKKPFKGDKSVVFPGRGKRLTGEQLAWSVTVSG